MTLIFNSTYNLFYHQPVELTELHSFPTRRSSDLSLGSKYKGIPSGTMGEFGIYSFNGNKIITTSGGGALISNNEEQIQKARFLSTQARDPALHYQHSVIGYNYRMSNIVAGIGRGQLEVLEERVKMRRANFKRYEEAFGSIEGLNFQPELKDTY